MPTCERLDHCETGESCDYPRPFRKMTNKRTRNNELMNNTALSCTITGPVEIHQYKTVPRHTQRTTALPSERSGGCSRIIEEREVSCSWQHLRKTCSSRLRRSKHCSHDNLQQDLADRKMANPVRPVLGHHTFQERQPAAVPELPNDKPHQPPK